MKPALYLIILIAITIISFPNTASAQKDTTGIEKVRLELKDGSTIVGDIIEEDELTIIIRTLSDLEIKVPKDKIREREIITGQIQLLTGLRLQEECH